MANSMAICTAHAARAVCCAAVLAACAPGERGTVECARAVMAGNADAGEVAQLERLPATAAASALVVWPGRVPWRAGRAVRDAGAAVAHEYRATAALLVTGTGAQLRAVHRALPDAAMTLGVAGTSALCVAAR